jgi:pimeloyl-ACP methyl ester carboxylesterase
MRVRVGDTWLWIDVDGAKLVPEGPVLRERPTVVLLHPGPGFDHSIFKLLVGPQLARIAQVVYVDQRGHGRSGDGAAESLVLDRWADDVRELCDAVGIDRPVVFGAGWGAQVAARYAARHPDHPGRLVLASPGSRLVPARVVSVYDRIGEPEAGDVAHRFHADPSDQTFAEFARVCLPLLSSRTVTAETITLASWNPAAYINWLRGEGATVDIREGLELIQAPVLVVTGDDDPVMPLASVEETVAALPSERVRFVRYAGARHRLFYDAPEAFDELTRFVLEPDEDEA